MLDHDVQVELSSTRIRPGFQATYTLDVSNNGNIAKSVNLSLEVDTLLKNIVFSEPPSTIANKKFTWVTGNLGSYISKKITVTGTIPADPKLIGKELFAFATIAISDDAYLANNKDTVRTIISGSYDPNDKQAFSDNGTAATYIGENKTLEYMIRFQNKGTDTAFTVVVKDTIASTLDISNFKMLSASHSFSLDIVQNHVLVWTFSNILLPDDKVNEPGSHGYVKFRIGQHAGNVIGTRISNQASIYFDFNPAIVTNEEIVTVGEVFFITGVKENIERATMLQLMPNPAKEQYMISSDMHGQLEIFDMQANKILSREFAGKEIFSAETMAPGLYFVKITGAHGSVSQKLVIRK